jgi:hypothetical protein
MVECQSKIICPDIRVHLWFIARPGEAGTVPVFTVVDPPAENLRNLRNLWISLPCPQF